MMKLSPPTGFVRIPGRSGQTGFTLIELTIVMVVAGLLLVPLIRIAGQAVISSRLDKTQIAIDKASAALISYAASHGGCLPYAADFEGGLPDTDASGVVSATADTGKKIDLQNAGDIPWLELGLTNQLLDSNGLRIQYYVASPFSDKGEKCKAGFRGFQWGSSVNYDADGKSIWVYDYDPNSGDRHLYEIKKKEKLNAGTHPSDDNKVDDHPNQILLPDPLLQVRRGPDVTAAAPQNDVISSQNVFILIAPGPNRNTTLSLQYIRDNTHKTAAGGDWTPSINTVDDHIFSLEPNVDPADSANNGDDTVFIMSFTQFKAELSKHGLNMEPVCEDPC